jgi:hypothetical protein
MDKKPTRGQLLGMFGGNDLVVHHDHCADRHFSNF